jgi:hypothetical protein
MGFLHGQNKCAINRPLQFPFHINIHNHPTVSHLMLHNLSS